jgi:CheY-like chemotaxis protein
LPYTFNKYDFQTEISWICIALISDRSLSESEESLLIKSKLFPKFLPLRSANTESAAFGSVQFCACLADQCETLESLITKPEWQRFSTLPLVIFRDSARTESNPDTSTANFEIEIGDRGKAISQLNQVRMFTCADFFSESTQPKTTKGSGSVLLIDDSELTLEALQRLLEASGYECTVAATIDSALDALRHSPFDIIVADRFVGEFDFMEVLRRERIGIRYHVPILILSADSDTSKATDIAELAIDKVLTKPVSSIQLLDAVAQLIDKHMPERNSDSDLTVASSIDWELLDELIGFTADPEHARQVLQRFEDEILSDCVRCLGYLYDRHFAELAALLHRMSGAALLFGARGLSDVLEGVRCGAIGGYIEAQAIEAIQGLDSILCEFLRECRNRYSF